MSQRKSTGITGSPRSDRRHNRPVRFRRFSRAKRRLFRRRFAAVAAAALLFLLLLFSSAMLRRPAAEQAPVERAPVEGAAGVEAGVSTCFYELLLGFEIPSLQPPYAEGRVRIRALLCTVLYTLTGINPACPFTFLNLELAAGKAVSLPAATPAPPMNTASPPADSDKPDPGSQPWGGSLSPLPPDGDGAPKILLYHTHGSESFIPGTAAAGSVPTVVTAGAELARMLEENYGLAVLHHLEIYDQPRREAYRKARPVIKELIAENPSVELVIDLHRDGVARSRTTAVVGERELASILMVHGCRNPGAAQNLELVFSLENELEAVLAPLSRGVMQQDLLYNQDLHPYAILLELGGHENSIDEALDALPYLAEAIARTYHLFFTPR
ncbi:MAG: hypothetical protein GX883_08660 [Firmicutes bacterium]|nr:hypothetical protein [Bacillota bacterium]